MKTLLTGIIRLYQFTLSPILGGCCRFQPSCSAYCIEAMDVHGWAGGMLLSIGRICRCHPFHPGGLDPVPQKKEIGIETDDAIPLEEFGSPARN